MKLIYCRACQDIIKLNMKLRLCACGKSWGRYGAGGVLATISATAVPLAINNLPFDLALEKREEDGASVPFEACVIHKSPRRITIVDGPPPEEKT